MKANLSPKTVVVTLIMLTSVVLFASCKAQEKDHLAYQEYPIKAECVLSVRQETYPFILDVDSCESARLTFIGSRLEGSVIELSDDTAFFVNDGYRIPLELSQGSALRSLLFAFSLSSSDMTKVTESDGALTIGYRLEELSVDVTLLDNVPTAMELNSDEGNYGITFNNFTSGE